MRVNLLISLLLLSFSTMAFSFEQWTHNEPNITPDKLRQDKVLMLSDYARSDYY